MIRRGWIATGAVVAAVTLLAGCSSGSGSTGTTASSASGASAPASSAAMSSGQDTTGGAATTVGGDVTEFDAQTTTWFDTFCTGMAPLQDLSNISTATSNQQISDALSTAGTAFQDTAGKLSALPAPTFDGGDQLARTVQSGLESFGQTFVDFSSQAAQLKEGDTAALQQFETDLESEMSQSPIADLQLGAGAQAQAKKIP